MYIHLCFQWASALLSSMHGPPPVPALHHISTTSQQRKRVSSLSDPLNICQKNKSDPTCGQCHPYYQKVEESLSSGNIHIHSACNINLSISTSPPNTQQTCSWNSHSKKHFAYHVQEISSKWSHLRCTTTLRGTSHYLHFTSSSDTLHFTGFKT